MGFLARWEQLKKDFEVNANKSRPKESVKKAIIGTVQKSSGLTPILKDVDTAIQKEERAPLEQSLNKLFAARGTYALFLSQEQKNHQSDPNDPNMIVWSAYRDLIVGMEKIEVDAAAEAKKLQTKKGGGKVAIEWLSLDGDLKGTIAAAKKDLTPFAALEKKHGVLKKADPALKDTEKYTKAAARTEYKNAREALTSFKASAKKCAEDLAKVLAAEKSSADFTKAVTKFHDAMKALSVLSRVDAQIRNLTAAEQG